MGTYTVLYGGHLEDRHILGEQGWGQSRTVDAENHRAAAIKGASDSQHYTGARYAVIGEDDGSTGYSHLGAVMRVFEIASVEEDGGFDFSVHMVGRAPWTEYLGEQELPDVHGYYTIAEIYI